MKHLTINTFGSFIGIDGDCLLVKEDKSKRLFPLNRLSSVSIAKRGVSLSSDLVHAFSQRGVKLFFLDFRGVAHSAILGQSQHGVVAVRQAQYDYYKTGGIDLMQKIIYGKIKNQRAVLSYLNKYHQNDTLTQAIVALQTNANNINQYTDRDKLLGLEGASAASYFRALADAKLFSSSFTKREKRGSREVNNAMLNLGYAVLSSYILNSIVNAGLEPYLGILHVQRAGKMALVLDLMEEYRAWVVDRAVIKLRQQSEGKDKLDDKLKKNLIKEVQATCSKKYPYRSKKVRLEHIIQRQVYRLCGHFYGEKIFKPYLFKW